MDNSKKQREAERLRRERQRAKSIAERSAPASSGKPSLYKGSTSTKLNSRRTQASAHRNHMEVQKGFLVVCAEFIRGILSDITSFFSDIGSPRSSKASKINRLDKTKRAFVVIAVGLLLTALLTGSVYGIFWAFTNKNADIIYLNDKRIGVLKKMDISAADLAQIILTKLNSDLNVNIQTSDTITMEPVHASKKELVTIEHVTAEIIKKLDYTVEACVIYVNDLEIAVVKDQSTADEILSRITNQYIQAGLNITRTEFVDKVKPETEYVKQDRIILDSEAYAILTATTETGKTYEVKPGDMLWSIADAHNMTRSEILKINPGVTAETILKIGQTLNITVSKPLVSVKTVETVKYKEVVKKETETKQNPNEYKTYSKVIQQGSDGEREVTAERIRINGFEDENIIISSEITISPVNEIIEVGTSNVPPKKALGMFVMPASGKLTQKFSAAKDNHDGIDIGNSKGTPVYASDGGKIIAADWDSGGYGYLIKIDHGSGFVSWYAHCSKILVKKGEMVYQGQNIALMGSSGDSSGSHLHFEIRQNGVPVNPLKLIQ